MTSKNSPPTIYMLVGLPGSGKSTWRSKFLASNVHRDPVIISTDDLIDSFAQANGLNYTEAFAKVNFKQLDAQARAEFNSAVANRRDIIVDRTNMSRKSRASWLASLPKDYRKVAVIFQVSPDELRRRLDARAASTGKSIPKHVIDSMSASYEVPDSTEFDDVRLA